MQRKAKKLVGDRRLNAFAPHGISDSSAKVAAIEAEFALCRLIVGEAVEARIQHPARVKQAVSLKLRKTPSRDEAIERDLEANAESLAHVENDLRIFSVAIADKRSHSGCRGEKASRERICSVLETLELTERSNRLCRSTTVR